jgi:hypothetical protein
MKHRRVVVAVGLPLEAARPSLSLYCIVPAAAANAPLQFYPPGEADEVDGIEEGLDKWLEGLWPVLRKAVQPEGAAEAAPPLAAAAAPAAEGTGGEEQLAGVPPLPRCRVRLVWQESGRAAAGTVRAAEAAAPSAAEVAYRDPQGHYSAVQPFWAPVTDAKYLTTDLSGPDRQASTVCWTGQCMHAGLSLASAISSTEQRTP